MRDPRLPQPEQRHKGRLFAVAVALACVAHGAVLICLLVDVRSASKPSAPGEKAVQMVFETQASAPPPAQPAPQPVASAPLMDMPDEPPQAVPPPLPLTEDTLPDMPVFKVRPVAHSPVTRPQQRAAMVHGATSARPQPTVPSGPVAAANPVAQPQSDTGPQSSAHTAKGGGNAALKCTPPQTHYPAMARRLHEEGEAVVDVTLAASGTVSSVKLAKSSGYDDLDEQALAAARALRCAPPENGETTGRIPVAFHIQ